jgi:hemerythrin-like domain-containing protein
MSEAIVNLIREHRDIEQVLDALESFVDTLGRDPERERGDIADFVRFFEELVDRCHHGKEENYLFTRMHDYGFSREKGPVSAMLSEQGEGRDHLLALASIAAGTGILSPRERADVRGHGLGYIMRIRPHIKREEDILFPMVMHSLPEFVLDDIDRDFHTFETSVLPADFHTKIQLLSARLITAYPPNQSAPPSMETFEH